MKDALVTLDLAEQDPRGWQGVGRRPLAPLAPLTVRRQAVVNHGRWVVRCPCGSASLAPEPPAPVQCADCGEWAEVEWPAPEFRAELETLLLARPGFRQKNAESRNWEPYETLEVVRAGNSR